MSAGAVFTTDHVSKWYGQVIGLNDVSVTVDPGITGLLGPNGAGKSTFMSVTLSCQVLHPRIAPRQASVGTGPLAVPMMVLSWRVAPLWSHCPAPRSPTGDLSC